MLKWISEAEELPPIAQKVLLMSPRQSGEFWDVSVAQILVDYEGVAPHPVKPGDPWPIRFYWKTGRTHRDDTHFVTGNSWWASLKDIPLPPGAQHVTDREFNYIAQPELVWIAPKKMP